MIIDLSTNIHSNSDIIWNTPMSLNIHRLLFLKNLGLHSNTCTLNGFVWRNHNKVPKSSWLSPGSAKTDTIIAITVHFRSRSQAIPRLQLRIWLYRKRVIQLSFTIPILFMHHMCYLTLPRVISQIFR